MTGKQLKNSILQWAIQGKLVPQDPNDEPASVLLEKIRAEKARLVKEGKIKRDKKESIIYRGEDNSYYEKFADGKVVCIDDEIPFEVPNGWEWCRLMNLGITETGTTPSKLHPEYFGNDIAFLGPANILNDTIISETQGLSKLGIQYARVVPANTILQVCIGGSIGKCAITDKDVTFNQQINSITPILCNHKFLHYILQSEWFRLNILEKATGTATPIINRGNWECLLIPLPPLGEQERIVKKLIEVMPHIKQYGDNQDALDFLNKNVGLLLKKSILQEAIQGKLVPQDPNDEPASVLLDKIAEEKQRLVKEGILKKKDLVSSTIFRGDDNKYYEQIGETTANITDEIPFEEPMRWGWCRLKDICSIFTGATFKKEEATSGGVGIRVWRGGNILPFALTNKPDDLFLPKEKVKESILLKRNDIVTPAVTSLENIGKMARVKDDMPTTTIGGFVFIIRLYYNNEILSRYILALMSSPLLIEYMKSITNKSGQAFYNIGKERLGMALLPIPPITEQVRIVTKIEELFDKIKG